MDLLLKNSIDESRKVIKISQIHSRVPQL